MSQDFYFLLMPGFSAIGFISAIEPLRVANRFRGELYRWHVLSADGGAVLASNGMSVNADAALEPLDVRFGRDTGFGAQRLPGENGMDGFFVARLRKR